MKFKSFFKSQWYHMLMGVTFFCLSIWQIVEQDTLDASMCMISSAIWFIMAFVTFNDERITKLENKIDRFEYELEKLNRR